MPKFIAVLRGKATCKYACFFLLNHIVYFSTSNNAIHDLLLPAFLTMFTALKQSQKLRKFPLKLDEAMTSSRTRIVQAPRPQSVSAVEAALAEHTRDGDYVNQLIAEVNAKANTLASLVAAEPTATDGPSRVRRYVEVPYTTPGPGDAELAKSVRSELCIATAGLETRSKDWERVFNAHKHTLEERAKQLGRMTEMDVSGVS